jgi:hypothetical protein
VDTEGLVLKVKVHSAKLPDQDGLKLLLDSARTAVSHLKHLWLDAGYEGRGRQWVEETLGLSVEIVRRPPERLSSVAQEVGGRANLLLALSEQEDEQGLREAVRDERSFRLRSDDASDAKAVGSCLVCSKQFHRGCPHKFA